MFRKFVRPVTIIGVFVSPAPLSIAENTAMMEKPMEPERMTFRYSFADDSISPSRFGKMFISTSESGVRAVRITPVNMARKTLFQARDLTAFLLPAPMAFAIVTVAPILAAIRTT